MADPNIYSGLLAAGLGILGQQRRYGEGPLAPVGRGGLIGLQEYQQQQQLAQAQELRRQQIEMQKALLAVQLSKSQREKLYPVLVDGRSQLLPESEAVGKEPAPKQTAGASSSLAKLLADREAFAAAGKDVSVFDQAIQKAVTRAPPIQIQSFAAPVPVVDPATGEQRLMQFGNRGESLDTGFKPVPKLDKASVPTESERKAAVLLGQMRSATQAVNPGQVGFADQLDVDLAGGLTNPLASESGQKTRQAQEQWAEAFLRYKTGAATTKDEVSRNIRTFFPRFGDSPAVVKQKAEMRASAERDMELAAGRAIAPSAKPPSRNWTRE